LWKRFVSSDRSPDATAPGPLETFRENCAQCHGTGGAGGAKGPQILNPVNAYATYVVRNGRGIEMGFADEMPMVPTYQISDADLQAILTMLGEATKPTTGEGLYVRFCGNCHGADAWGGRVGKGLTDELDELREAVRDGHGGSRFGERDEYMPAWTSSALANPDIALIEAYLPSLPPGPDDDDDDDDSDQGSDEAVN
jgi:mono/diheme cytochrome c family protein